MPTAISGDARAHALQNPFVVRVLDDLRPLFQLF